MKKIFSNYYKIILSVVILIVLVALKEDYKTSFDEMSGVRTVVRMLDRKSTRLNSSHSH